MILTTRTRKMIQVLACAAALGAASTALTSSAALAAEPANKITTKAVAEPLKKAQAAMKKKQWDTAAAEIKKAQAVQQKTAFETYQLDEFLGYILIQQKKFGEAAPVFERALNSGRVPAAQVDDRMRTLAELYFQLKNDRKAVEWANKFLSKNPNQQDVSVLLAQAEYRLGDYKNATAHMNKVISGAERAGRQPAESWLQIVQSSQYKLNDNKGSAAILSKLVRYYPKPEYWTSLLDIYSRDVTDDSLKLGYYRLMNEVGVLKRRDRYFEMAQLAIDAGVPSEAQQILETGLQNGALKTDDKLEHGRIERLLNMAKQRTTADRASLEQLAQEGAKAAQGQVDVGLGQDYLGYGRYDDAIAALKRGIGKGGVTDIDAAQLSLGRAYLEKGQKDQARQAFKAVDNKSKWSELAQLWELHSYAAA